MPSVKCSEGEDFRPSNDQLTQAYIKLFEQTFGRLETGQQKATIRNIAQLFSSLFLRTGVDNCRICSSADYHPILAIDINGDIYPCDYFFGKPEYRMGNVTADKLQEVLNSSRNLRSKSIEDTACVSCNVKRVCGGGCMADRIFSGGKPYYCKTYSEMYNYLGSKIPELRKKGLIGKLL